MPTGILFALIAFFAWGFGDLLFAIASKKIDSSSLTFWSFLIRISVFILMIPFFWHEVPRLSSGPIVMSLVLGLISAIGFVSYFEAFRKTHAAIVGSISLSWGVISLLISLVLFGEILLPKQILAILLILSGLFLTLFNVKEIRESHIFKNSGGLFALVAMVTWGIFGAFVVFPIEQIGWFWTTFFAIIPFALVFPFLKMRKQKFHIPSTRKLLLIIVGAALLEATAELSYNIGIDYGQVSVVAPIAGSYAVLMVGLSFIVFKEKISRMQIIGIITTLLGIVALSFLSF